MQKCWNLLKENIELNSFVRVYNLISYNQAKYSFIHNQLTGVTAKFNRNNLHVTTSIKISFFMTLLVAILIVLPWF